MSNGIIKKIDNLLVKSLHWEHIPFSETNFLYLSVFTYKGKPKALTDGTTINKGDLVGEIHIDNENLKNLNTSYFSLIRTLQGELKALKTCYLEATPKYSEIKAIYGISVFYEILKRQDFSILKMDNSLLCFFGSVWENILRLSLNSGNKKSKKKFIFSRECWISKGQIESMIFKDKKKANSIK